MKESSPEVPAKVSAEAPGALSFRRRHPEVVMATAALAAGLVFGTGFEPLAWRWPAFAALTAFFLLFAERPTPRAAALSGFLFGLGWFVPGLSWTMNSIAVYGRLPWAVAALALFLLGTVLSLFPAASAWCARRVSGEGRIAGLLSLAGFWVFFEWLRGDAVANFGWLLPGYAALDMPFAGWAPVLGAYGVTLAQLVSAALVAVALGCRLKWLAAPVVGLAIFLGGGEALKSVVWSTPSGIVDVRVLQPNLPVVSGFDRADPAERIRSLYTDAFAPWGGSDRPRLLLTPEGVVNVAVSRLGGEAAGALMLLQEKSDAKVLFNGFRRERGRYYNTSFVLDEGTVVYKLDKRALVPFGEYVPAGARWFVDMLGIPMADLAEGDAVQPLFKLSGADAGVLICYENLYGSVVRSFWQSRSPDFLIVTSNLGWFGESILSQHLAMSRMRAMEVARPLVSVSNSGMSALVNSKGGIVRTLKTGEPDAMTVALLGARGKATPYIRFGNVPAVILAFLLAFHSCLLSVVTQRLRAWRAASSSPCRRADPSRR